MVNYFIGVDIGTQSLKTLIINGDDGRIVDMAKAEYNMVEGLPFGHKEQKPEDWILATEKTIKEVLSSKIDPKNVKGIGISGQQHGFVPIDEKGNVIRPAKLWNDTSTTRECEHITQKLGGEGAVIDLIGNPILAGYTAPKILWLKINEPWNYERLKTFLLPHDYLNFFLTGNKVMEFGDASGTALMDIRTRKWSKDVLDTIDPDLKEKVPPLHYSDEPAGFIRKEVAERFRFNEDLIVSAGGGDNMMSAIGTGNTKEGILTASFGTSGTIYAYSKTPVIDPKGEIAAFCDSTNAWLPLVCTMNVTVATELVRRLFRYSYEKFENDLLKIRVGSDGLLLLPYIQGERTPNIPEATGVLFGLNDMTFDAPHIARAAIEGVTMSMNYGLNRMIKLGIEPRQIRLTGGGAKNKAWRQIASNIFNTEVVCLKVEESAAYGAAIHAMWSYSKKLGKHVTIQELTDRFVEVDTKTIVTPKKIDVDLYKSLQKLQDNLSKNLKKEFRLHQNYIKKYLSS